MGIRERTIIHNDATLRQSFLPLFRNRLAMWRNRGTQNRKPMFSGMAVRMEGVVGLPPSAVMLDLNLTGEGAGPTLSGWI